MKASGSCFAVFVFVFGAVAVVRGDLAPAFVGKPVSFPAMRFENLAEYPRYDFYLKYAHGPGNPYVSPHVTPVRPGEVLRSFEGTGRIGDAFLVAVPRGQPAPSPGQDTEFWSKALPPGGLRSESLEGIHLGADHLVSYGVQIDGDKLAVTLLRTEQRPGSATARWLTALSCLAVPLAFCVAVAWFGIRLARRRFPAKPASPPA